jgi:hypothetical protein
MEWEGSSRRVGWVTILGYLAICGILIGML